MTEYDDREYLLSNLQAWVFDNAKHCTDGLLDPAEPSRCFAEDVSRLVIDEAVGSVCEVTTRIDGIIPVFMVERAYSAISGEQIASYTTDADGCFTKVYYASDFQTLLDEQSGPLYEGIPLPASLAKLGIYLHALQDRISHYRCLDNTLFSGPTLDRWTFDFISYSNDLCNQGAHSEGHYWEVGLKEGQDTLPEQVYSALDYTYEELNRFARTLGEANQWALVSEPFIEKDQAVHELIRVLEIADACARLEAMIRLNRTYGFSQMPGNDLDSAHFEALCGTAPTAVPSASEKTHGSKRL